MRALALAIVLAGSMPAAAQRLQLAPEVEVGAGYDDNLFLNATLVGSTNPPVADGILHVEPRLLFELRSRGHALALRYDLIWHEPLSGRYGSVTDHLATLEYRPPVLATPLLPLVLSLQALGERYDATFTSLAQTEDYDAFWLGGAELDLALTGRSGRAGAGYRFAERSYPNRNQRDQEQRLLFYYDHRPLPNFASGVTYGYTYIGSTMNGAPDFIDGLSRHRFGLPLRYAAPDFSVAVEASLALQSLPGFLDAMLRPLVRHDQLFGISLAMRLHLSANFDLFVRYDLLRASSDDPTGDFARNQVVAGLLAHVSMATGSDQVAPATAPERESLRPQLLPDHRVRFRLRAPGAQSVAVVGDWSGWDASAGVMTRSGQADETFEVTLEVPPGRHHYSFLVDQKPVRPPDAESYVSDGFDSENGVLEVSE
ncbi:MAG TPA: isoamylase early set domain-containing protein [Polyangia bacterium]|nr:isoamylase early set domain-containing protein [Polyangia bacterium]